jgi:hypothetical protein
MKKFALIALGLLTATAITANAQDKKKKELTDDQKKVMKEITEKYDANKNGKLDPDEREKISAEDKEKMAKAGLGGGKKKDK